MNSHLSPTERYELASAYLDGAASENEITLVEADSSMLAIVEQLRGTGEAISELLPEGAAPPAASLRATHLSAAMAEFDALASPGSNSAATSETTEQSVSSNVTSLAEHAQHKTATQPLEHVRPQRSYPRWLSAAAVSLVVLGGVSAAVSLSGSSSDSDASIALATADESSVGESDGAVPEAMMTEAAEDESAATFSEDAMAGDEAAGGDLSMEALDGSQEDTTEAETAEEADVAEATTTTAIQSATGPAPQYPTFALSTPPEAILASLTGPGNDISTSKCFDSPSRSSFSDDSLGYFSILLDDPVNGALEAELFVLSEGPPVLIDVLTCTEIPSS